MPTRSKRTAGLAGPTGLPSFDADDADLTVVIIETPKGSRNLNKVTWEERVQLGEGKPESAQAVR